MSGNGRGTMRPTSRSPPFLVIGLLVALGILAFNYWNLSSRNKELSMTLEGMQADFHSVSEKRLVMEKRAISLNADVADLQTKLNQIQNSASEKDNAVTELKGQVASLNNQLQKTSQSLEQAKTEVQQVENEKTSVNGELEKVREQLKAEQTKKVVCDKGGCQEVLRDVMKAVLDGVGKTAVITALSAQHSDVLNNIQDLLMKAKDPEIQKPVINQQLSVQGNGQQQGGEQTKQVQGDLQNMGQNFNLDPNNHGQDQGAAADPNVIQMQQPEGAAALPQGAQMMGAVNQSSLTVGHNQPVDPRLQNAQQDLRNQKPSLLRGEGWEADQQKDNQMKPDPALKDGQQKDRQEDAQNEPADVQKDLEGNKQQMAPQNIPQEGEGGKQVIVPQNIPQGEGEEPRGNNNNEAVNNNDINAASAQEDIDNQQPDLPKDEMDKQAEVNDQAGNGAGDLDNLDNSLRDQLQDLSKHKVIEDGIEDDGKNEGKVPMLEDGKMEEEEEGEVGGDKREEDYESKGDDVMEDPRV